GGLRPVAEAVSAARHSLLELQESCIAGRQTSFSHREHSLVPRHGFSQVTERVVELNQFGCASQRGIGSSSIELLAEFHCAIEMPNRRRIFVKPIECASY